MNVVIDTSVLIELLNPKAKPEIRARLTGLLSEITEARGRLIIPTPVLSEFLALARNHAGAFETLHRHAYVEVAAFDYPAALECAAMTAIGLARPDRNKRWPAERGVAWQKVKVDRQIAAIAKVRRAQLVSDDPDLPKIAAATGLKVCTLRDLPIPDSERQMKIEVDAVPARESVEPPRRIVEKRKVAELGAQALAAPREPAGPGGPGAGE